MNILKLAKNLKEFTLEDISMLAEMDVENELKTLLNANNEMDYKKCPTFEELAQIVDEYMYNYNYNRKQWTKSKMTPIEYKEYLLAS